MYREDADIYFTKSVNVLDALIMTKKAAHENDVIDFETIRAQITTLEGQYNDVIAMRKARIQASKDNSTILGLDAPNPTDE